MVSFISLSLKMDCCDLFDMVEQKSGRGLNDGYQESGEKYGRPVLSDTSALGV